MEHNVHSKLHTFDELRQFAVEIMRIFALKEKIRKREAEQKAQERFRRCVLEINSAILFAIEARSQEAHLFVQPYMLGNDYDWRDHPKAQPWSAILSSFASRGIQLKWTANTGECVGEENCWSYCYTFTIPPEWRQVLPSDE